MDGRGVMPIGRRGCRAAIGGAIAARRRRKPNPCYGGQNSMRLGPTALQRGAETVCAHLGRRRHAQRPLNVERLAPLALVVGKSPGGASIPSSLPTVLEAAREALPSLGWTWGVAERAIDVEVLWLGLCLCG
jgi:hypothetical protein